MPERPDARTALRQLQEHEAWAVVRLRDSETVTFVGGDLIEAERLADIPRKDGVPVAGRRFDSLVAVPFR